MDDSPHELSHESPPPRFRSSFAPLWRLAGLISGATAGFAFAAGWLFGKNVPVPSTLGLSLGLGAVFAAAMMASPVSVLPGGLRGYTYWARFHTVPWAEMGAMERRRLMGLWYLTIEWPGGDPIWLPLYLSDTPGFIQAVRERAGDGHPLVGMLERYRV